MTTDGGETVTVIGGERLAATLHAASREIKTMRDAQEKTGRLLQLNARTRAPRESGRLASSIVVASAGPAVTVSTNVEYAAVQEFGWAGHNIAAHPYLIGPSDDLQPVFTQYYADDAQGALAKVRGA